MAPVRVGPYAFDNATYDKAGDVLYLRVGAAMPSVADGDTPEGHAWLYPLEPADSDQVIGLDVMNARWLLDHEGKITVSLPDGGHAVVENVPAVVGADS